MVPNSIPIIAPKVIQVAGPKDPYTIAFPCIAVFITRILNTIIKQNTTNSTANATKLVIAATDVTRRLVSPCCRSLVMTIIDRAKAINVKTIPNQ